MNIFKYQIEVSGLQTIEMHTGSRILSIQTQQGMPCIWALVNPSRPKVGRRIGIYGTGHNVSESVTEYIGTFQIEGGSLVFHAFDLGEQ